MHKIEHDGEPSPVSVTLIEVAQAGGEDECLCVYHTALIGDTVCNYKSK